MKLRNHLNPPTVISCIALFAALGGVAYAAVPKNSVGTQQLRNGAVNTGKLRNNAVTTPKLRNNAVSAAKLRNNAVITEKIADGAIDSTKLGQGSVRAVAIGGGVVTNAKLQNSAVNEPKLASNSVSSDKLTANAVATGKVQDGAISAAKLNAGLLAQLVKDVSYVSQASGAPTDTSPQTATAVCPAGKQVVGGGYRAIEGDATVVQSTESFPFVSAGKRTGWSATVKTSESGKTFAVEAYAICATF